MGCSHDRVVHHEERGLFDCCFFLGDHLARQQTMADETGPYKQDVQASGAQPSRVEHEVATPLSLDGSQQCYTFQECLEN